LFTITFVAPGAGAEAFHPAIDVNAVLICTAHSLSRAGSWFTRAASGKKTYGSVVKLALAARSSPVLLCAHPVLIIVFAALFACHGVVTVFAREAAGEAEKSGGKKEPGKHFSDFDG